MNCWPVNRTVMQRIEIFFNDQNVVYLQYWFRIEKNDGVYESKLLYTIIFSPSCGFGPQIRSRVKQNCCCPRTQSITVEYKSLIDANCSIDRSTVHRSIARYRTVDRWPYIQWFNRSCDIDTTVSRRR